MIEKKITCFLIFLFGDAMNLGGLLVEDARNVGDASIWKRQGNEFSVGVSRNNNNSNISILAHMIHFIFLTSRTVRS